MLGRKGARQRRRSPVSLEERDAVFDVAVRDSSAYGARDAAIFAMVCGAGLRNRDLVTLQLDHLDLVASRLNVIRNCCSIAVDLPPVACDALRRWLDFRGESPGALINPIRRTGRVLERSVSPSLVNDSLLRRCLEAGVTPFTADDAVRTISVATLGRWHGAPKCPQTKPDLTNPAATVFPDAQNPGRLLVVRYLSRLGHTQRSALLERLDRLALMISGGTHRAFDFEWTEIRADQLPPTGAAIAGCTLRSLNKLKDALHGVLREGVAVGSFDPNLYSAIVRQKWAVDGTCDAGPSDSPAPVLPFGT